jgi:hypothetical protein
MGDHRLGDGDLAVRIHVALRLVEPLARLEFKVLDRRAGKRLKRREQQIVPPERGLGID